jgi:hypothetical protein
MTALLCGLESAHGVPVNRGSTLVLMSMTGAHKTQDLQVKQRGVRLGSIPNVFPDRQRHARVSG